MKVLVACEFSGIVRRAFRARGHEAYSCDLLPAEDGSSHHFQADALEVIGGWQWDMLIAHPPCTYLTNAANRWLYESCATTTPEERIREREKGIDFFLALKNSPIPKKAIENPRPHPYVLERIGRQSDVIQPYFFGDEETKGIWLWLEGLPPLFSTMTTENRKPKVHRMSPGGDRQKERSRFFPGVAEAMSQQWG